MSNLHPIFEDIVNAMTGRPASVSGHIVAAAVEAAPDHGSPDRNMVAAENLSAAALDPTPAELAAVQARYRAEGRARVMKKVRDIDTENPGTPATRFPWES